MKRIKRKKGEKKKKENENAAIIVEDRTEFNTDSRNKIDYIFTLVDSNGYEIGQYATGKNDYYQLE